MKYFICFLITGILHQQGWADVTCPYKGNRDTFVVDSRKKALLRLAVFDTCKTSLKFPNIAPIDFYQNIERNILTPEAIFQGNETFFCGYAALTTMFCRAYPDKYVELMLSLYEHGQFNQQGKIIEPENRVAMVAGKLEGKGLLNENPADQLLFFTLADQYKSYLNQSKLKYKAGYENNNWASMSFAKFNRMARDIAGFEVVAYGADLLKPKRKSNVDYLKKQMENGQVVLFVNSRFLHPNKFRLYSMRTPTHFILLHQIEKTEHGFKLTYWDYGFKTTQEFSNRIFQKLIFGISILHEK